jgi:HAD superfamily hydrolase (TIGR01459 family)
MKPTRFLSAAFTVHSSFREIASQYDGFILDQYGVLHNGQEPLPGAMEALKDLKDTKRLVILSNTSSPAKSALEKLRSLGFDPDWFVAGAVTSGEEASNFVAKTYGSSATVKKAIFLTYKGTKLTPPPLDFIQQCGNIQISASVEEADFVIAHGAEVWYQGVEEHVLFEDFMHKGSFEVLGPILEACRERNLPMICANPDFIVRFADNRIGHMPGKIAAYYENIGGEVTYFGKPFPEHFEACLRKLDLDKSKVAHVGDSLHHDIAGANASGIDSVFVTSGIHLDDLETAFGEMPSLADLESLFDKEKSMPTHVVAAFSNISSS